MWKFKGTVYKGVQVYEKSISLYSMNVQGATRCDTCDSGLQRRAAERPVVPCGQVGKYLFVSVNLRAGHSQTQQIE